MAAADEGSLSAGEWVCYHFAGAAYDTRLRELRVGSEVVKIERLPLHLLEVLLQRDEAPVSKDELLGLLWKGQRAPGDQSLFSAVKRLRDALGKEAGARVRTEHGKGYRLQGPVKREIRRHANQPLVNEAETARAQLVSEFFGRYLLQPVDLYRAGSAKPASMRDTLRIASAAADSCFTGQPVLEAEVRYRLGNAYLHLVMARPALREFRKAIALLEPFVDASDPKLLVNRFGIVQALVREYESDEAQIMLDLAKRDAGYALLTTIPSELALAALRATLDVMLERQQNSQAIEPALRLIQLTDAWPPATITDRFDARQRLAEIYVRLGNIVEANRLLKELTAPPFGAAQVSEVTYGRARINVAKLLTAEGKQSEARLILEEVYETLVSALGPRALLVGYAACELADACAELEDFQSAQHAIEAARAAFAESLDPHHGHVIASATNAARLDLEVGKSATALALLDEIRPYHIERSFHTDGVDFYRAWALCDLRRSVEAIAVLDSLNIARLAALSWGPDDWAWQVQAERGKALIGLGKVDEGRSLIIAALEAMSRGGSLQVVISRYRRFLAASPAIV